MDNNKQLKLSPQAVGSIMLAVQKGLMAAAEGKPTEECDITKILLGFVLDIMDNNELLVLNPPTLLVESDAPESEDNA